MSRMRKIFRLTCVGILVGLAGCNGGSDDDASAVVSGAAMAGPFKSGQVCAYSLAGGVQGARIVCGGFDANSRFSLDIGDYVGDVLLAVEGSAAYDDEATAGDETGGTPLTGTLRTIVHADGGDISAAITPFTEAAVKLAGNLTLSAIQAAAIDLKALLPVPAGLDLLATLPALASENTSAEAMAYREVLRALSQLQMTASMQGNLAGYLDNFVTVIEANGGAGLMSDILAAVNQGLASGCTVSGGALACTPGNGGGGGGGGGGGTALSCQIAGLRLPTDMEMIAASGTYALDKGQYDNSFTFVKSGEAPLIVGVTGQTFYDGVEYPLTSLCFENNATYGNMVILGFAQGHIDLFANDRSVSGVSPQDGVTILKSQVAAGGGTSGGTGGGTGAMLAGLTLSKSIGGISSLANSVATTAVSTNNATNVTTYRSEWGNALNSALVVVSHAIVPDYGGARYESLSVNLAKVGAATLSAQIENGTGGVCILSWTGGVMPGSFKMCSEYGIVYDHGAGTVAFSATPMKDMIGGNGSFTLSGGLNFTSY